MISEAESEMEDADTPDNDDFTDEADMASRGFTPLELSSEPNFTKLTGFFIKFLDGFNILMFLDEFPMLDNLL